MGAEHLEMHWRQLDLLGTFGYGPRVPPSCLQSVPLVPISHVEGIGAFV